MATDEFERAGFTLPKIPPEISERICKLVPPAGSMTRNPIDASSLMGLEQGRLLQKTGWDGWEKYLWNARFQRGDGGMGDFIGVMDDWPGLDFLVLHCTIDSNPGKVIESFQTTGCGPLLRSGKDSRLPAATVIHLIANEESWMQSQKLRQLCIDSGLPLFLSMKGAARAILTLMEFDRQHPGMIAELQASLK